MVIDYRKGLDAPSQYRISREIREISTYNIGFNQFMVSHLYSGIDIPKCNKTLTAINNWIDEELEKKDRKDKKKYLKKLV